MVTRPDVTDTAYRYPIEASACTLQLILELAQILKHLQAPLDFDTERGVDHKLHVHSINPTIAVDVAVIDCINTERLIYH